MNDPLAKFDLLQELGEEGRQQLSEFLEQRSVEAGRSLFRTDDEAEEMLLVTDGKVRIESAGGRIGTLGSGDVLGAASLVAIGRRECLAIAESPVRLLVLSREGYLRLRSDLPLVALALLEGILREFAGVLRASIAETERGAE